MRLFPFQFSIIGKFLSKFPAFASPEKNSLSFLNGAQFLGALNDNIYKLCLIFYLIQLEGIEHSSAILATAGAIFVIPFLLFSSLAGILADRLSKSRIIVTMKTVEIGIIALGVLAFGYQIGWSSYGILFLLATHSAIFGPAKYGIIPELVDRKRVSKANGWITSFTYLAIIMGTFLASFLTRKTGYNFVLIATICLFFSLIGWGSSLGIKYTPPIGSKKKITPLFIRDIFHTLLACKKEKHLLVATCGSAYFLFVGGFTQLNIIPFAVQSLGLSEVDGGYLFLATASGIVAGSLLCGLGLKKYNDPGLSCICGLAIGLLFSLLSIPLLHLAAVTILLFFLGFFGGMFVVPLDSFIQLFSPEKNRGHVIAASNFLSFVGVLLASCALYFFHEMLHLSAPQSFFVMGMITLLFSFFLIARFFDLFLSYTARALFSRFAPPIDGLALLNGGKRASLLLFEEATPFRVWLLLAQLPNLHLLVPQYGVRRFPWFANLFFSLHRIETPFAFDPLVAQGSLWRTFDMIPCIYLTKKLPQTDRPKMFAEKDPTQVWVLRYTKKTREKMGKFEILPSE